MCLRPRRPSKSSPNQRPKMTESMFFPLVSAGDLESWAILIPFATFLPFRAPRSSMIFFLHFLLTLSLLWLLLFCLFSGFFSSDSASALTTVAASVNKSEVISLTSKLPSIKLKEIQWFQWFWRCVRSVVLRCLRCMGLPAHNARGTRASQLWTADLPKCVRCTGLSQT